MLAKIQPFVQQVAEATASALKVEVEVVDRDLVRVGGTNMLKEKLGVRQQRGFVNEYVLHSGLSFTIRDPGYHRLCQNCDLKGSCYYTAGLFCPIILEGEAIGIISLISFDNRERGILLRNHDDYLEFTLKMAELLAGKVSENRMISKLKITGNQMQIIIDSIDEGIMSVDTRGIVTYFNLAAERLLGMEKNEAVGKKIRELIPSSPLEEVLRGSLKTVNGELTYLNGSGRKIPLYCSAYPIIVDDKLAGVVGSFEPMEKLHKMALRVNNRETLNSFEDIIGNSPAITKVKEQAKKVALSGSTVLLIGESGTGKELIARAIHQYSRRRRRPFVVINCTAIPDTLLESELFGYEGGAFTGAHQGGKPGKFELAEGGTIFLDEIGEMPLYLQAKLLRVLQEKKIERVGGLKTIPLDIRIVAATNRDLFKLVLQGEFREDLYYRLCVVPLALPPLRERPQDIMMLAEYFLSRYNLLMSKEFKGFSADAEKILTSYHWPGNIRELENVVEYACNFETGVDITPRSLPVRIVQQPGGLNGEQTLSYPLQGGLKEIVKRVEQQVIKDTLNRNGSSSLTAKDQAARELGISRATLYRKLQEHGLLDET